MPDDKHSFNHIVFNKGTKPLCINFCKQKHIYTRVETKAIRFQLKREVRNFRKLLRVSSSFNYIEILHCRNPVSGWIFKHLISIKTTQRATLSISCDSFDATIMNLQTFIRVVVLFCDMMVAHIAGLLSELARVMEEQIILAKLVDKANVEFRN